MADEAQESLHPTTAAETEAAAAASEEGGQQQEAGQEQQAQGQAGSGGKGRPEPGSAFLGSYGNSVGDKGSSSLPPHSPLPPTDSPTTVSSTLSPVGKPLGKGLETVASPVGGLVEPLVGGVMKSGKGWGDQVGVGAGNQDRKKLEEMERERSDVGGKEQTAGNPLGLGEP
ncbi:MAG: hypothetical protein Q9219_003673 [cf. Caloplaca sp. 3 TL-2023]